MSFRTTIVVAALAAAGCDAQTTDDFPGDPLARIGGTVVNTSAVPAGGLEILVIWINEAASPEVFVGDRGSVETEFPSSFQLELFRPPPRDAMLPVSFDELDSPDPQGPRFGLAWITAFPPGIELAEDDGEEYDGPFGVSEQHVLCYVEADATLWIGGEPELSAGFHILQVIDVDDPECLDDDFDCLVPTELDLDTPVEIRIGTDEDLDPPGFT